MLFRPKSKAFATSCKNPPNVRKGAFGFTGIREIFSIPEGISGFNFSGGEVILLNNGFFELRCPLSNSVFQWNIDAYETFSHSEWLYPYVVCEFPVTFLRLVKAIYTDANIKSHILLFNRNITILTVSY